MSTTALDIMSTELITIQQGTSVEDALKTLINNKITGIPVVNAQNEMVGVLSEYDIIVQLAKTDPSDSSIYKAPADFSPNTKSIDTSTSLDEIVQIFIDSKFRRLPVVDSDKKLVGIITRRDLMRVFYYKARLS